MEKNTNFPGVKSVFENEKEEEKGSGTDEK